ncbi:MAG: NosD domain-containing protein [Planctomycetota bacterium]|jgi:parallel beta-helix repeat protein
MKLGTCLAAALALGSLLALAPPSAAGVAPEDAVVITSLPYSIERPGMYVLAGNLAAEEGITIQASGVTLDLRGFALTGKVDSHDGISMRGNRTDVEIRNGTVTGWGAHGIVGDTAYNGSFRDLRLSGNGGCGLRAGHGAVVENVMATGNGGSGIQGREAIVVKDALAAGNALWGLDLGDTSVLEGTSVVHNGAGGVLVASGALVRGNAVRENGWAGTGTDSGGCAIGTLAGIAVNGQGTLVEGNSITRNGIGLQLLAAGNTVSGNLVRGNELNYQFVQGNQLELLLAELPETILWPSRVVLAGSLQGTPGRNGLIVDANDVTVDLAGHALIGVRGSLCGILVRPERKGVHVFNGFLTGWDACGFNSMKAYDARLEGLTVHGNANVGVRVGPSSTIVNCVASGNGSDGIQTAEDVVVMTCSANDNGNDGVQVGPHSTVSGVTASENALFGIRAAEGTSVSESTASRNTFGIAVTKGGLVRECTTSFNSNIGIRAEQACLLIENVVDSNALGIGVMSGPGTRLDGNNLTNNDIGMNVSGTGNLVIRNTCFGNGTAFVIVAGNTWGPYINVAAGGTLGDISSWANFQD